MSTIWKDLLTLGGCCESTPSQSCYVQVTGKNQNTLHIYSNSKNILGTSASLLVTRALLVVTMFASNYKAMGFGLSFARADSLSLFSKSQALRSATERAEKGERGPAEPPLVYPQLDAKLFGLHPNTETCKLKHPDLLHVLFITVFAFRLRRV